VTGERDEGQAAVELALVLPLVVLLLLTVVQVTLVARDQVLVVHAARAGARAAAVAAPGSDQRDEVRHAALEASGLKSDRTIADMTRVGTTDTVIVRVRYAAPTDVPLVGALLPDVTLDADVTMRSEWRS
jgi:Flp pilus assembly protein TadG